MEKKEEQHEIENCIYCNGKGWVKDFYSLVTGKCHVCQGTGKRYFDKETGKLIK